MQTASAMAPEMGPVRSSVKPAPDVFADLFALGSRLGLALTEANGGLADASRSLAEQASAIHGVVSATQQMAAANRGAAEKLTAMGESVHEIGGRLSKASGAIEKRVGASRMCFSAVADNAREMEGQVKTAAAQVEALRKSSTGIQNVAREIQLLAVNAGVEAARHGVAGRGFAVIAEAVKKLADQTRLSAEQTEKHLVQLALTMTQLQTRSGSNLGAAQDADDAMTHIGAAVPELSSAREAVTGLAASVERTITPIQENVRVCAEILAGMKDGSARVDAASGDIATAVDRFEKLVLLGQDLSGVLIGVSDELPISGLVAACQETAGRIAAVFAAAIRSGELRGEQLFDENYRQISGANPPQYLTDFTSFTDRALPEIQEALLNSDRRISFCAAVDRNGYLPTHNRKFSQPPSEDPVWNTQNCRNRRIFNDRTGLASARSQKPVLLQTYRRDMGGGAFVVMHELAAPITVGGRHWGAFRIGFRGQP